MKDSEVRGRLVEKHLGSLEAQVMRVLWGTPNLTVRDVAKRLSGHRQRAYTTVMTVMNRLCEKGLLDRVPKGRAYTYSPRMSEGALLDDITRRTVSKLISDFGDVAVAGFVGEVRNRGPDELEKLRKLLEEA